MRQKEKNEFCSYIPPPIDFYFYFISLSLSLSLSLPLSVSKEFTNL